MRAEDLRYLILADGLFGPEESKTANACIRYTPERVVGVHRLAQRRQDRRSRWSASVETSPSSRTLDEGLALKPNALLIGIAPAGGQLPDELDPAALARDRDRPRDLERAAHLHRRHSRACGARREAGRGDPRPPPSAQRRSPWRTAGCVTLPRRWSSPSALTATSAR